MKKYISIILTISFLFALLPVNVFAQAGANAGTVGVKELPDAGIFDKEGTAFKKDAYA